MKIKLFIILIAICDIVNGQNPTADFRCTFYSFDTISNQCCIGFEDLATAINGSVISQMWNFGDTASGNFNTSTGHFLVHCYSRIGAYTVTFSVIDNLGNVDTLRALNCIVVDSSGCSCNWTTNIADIYGDGTQIQIYPNPVSNTFTLKNIPSNGEILLQIINPFGEIIYKENLYGENQYLIDANFAKGIYFVRVSDGEANFVSKLVVE